MVQGLLVALYSKEIARESCRTGRGQQPSKGRHTFPKAILQDGGVEALVKGCSGPASLIRMAKAVSHIVYAETEANWSDRRSQIGLNGAWTSSRGRVTDTCSS